MIVAAAWLGASCHPPSNAVYVLSVRPPPPPSPPSPGSGGWFIPNMARNRSSCVARMRNPKGHTKNVKRSFKIEVRSTKEFPTFRGTLVSLVDVWSSFWGGERELKLARKSGSSSGSQFQWNSGYGLVLFVAGFSRSRPKTAETQSLRNPRSHHTCKNTRIRALPWFHPWTHVLPACFTSQLLDDAIDMKMWLA